jgi:arylsulfatase A-like enzyme
MCLYCENKIMLTRRNFIRAAGLAFAGLAAPAGLAARKGNRPRSNPNVLIVLTDDQGYGDLSCHGNPILRTPNLDALYRQSIRFTDFHVAPMCTPTRGQLLTGRDAMDNGATFVCLGRSMIRTDLPTMADVFAANGYHTGHFGKWHLGDSYPYRPQDRGFEETIHHGAWGITSIADYYGNDYWDDTYRHNDRLEKYEDYCTNVWFDEAMDYMKARHAGNEPFFVYLATNCPHSPHWVDDKYSTPYEQHGLNGTTAKFFGQIANIDENMGRLLSMLDKTGMAENTLLIYMTDNGTVAGHKVFNAGMKGHKTELWEGGHRVPCFVRWPSGGLGKPRDIDVLSQCQDILPTLAELCNLDTPNSMATDGTPLAGLLHNRQRTVGDRMLVVRYGPDDRAKWECTVLWKKWRLVKGEQLYDVGADPHQDRDVAAQHPDVAAAMRRHYEQWWAETIKQFEQPRYIHLGSEKANPVVLYSCDWKGSYADNFGNLAAGNRIGSWDVLVERKGQYRITLSRWHPAAAAALDAPLEGPMGKGKAVPIAKARVKVGGADVSQPTISGQKQVLFTVPLDAGKTQLSTWFYDGNGKELCSAYYTRVERL